MKLRIKYKLTAPLSHIGETESTGSYFQTVLTCNDRLPVITGNSVRGILRDSMANHLLETLSDGKDPVKVDKDTFNILYSGGNINGTMKDDVEKAKQVRQHFPMISLIGGGLGDMIMAGKMLCSFAYPVCAESEWITGIQSDLSWHEMIDEIEFTRKDDGKNELLERYVSDIKEEKTAKASTQMRYSVQYVAAGTEFVQDLIFLPGTTELEVGALYAGLENWFKVPRLGGMAAKGFGFFNATVEDEAGNEVMRTIGNAVKKSGAAEALILSYEEFAKSEGTKFLQILSTKKGKKDGSGKV